MERTGCSIFELGSLLVEDGVLFGRDFGSAVITCGAEISAEEASFVIWPEEKTSPLSVASSPIPVPDPETVNSATAFEEYPEA